jgi:hypothetical protein
MTQESFQQTSNEPYVRHDYRIHFKSKKPEVYDNYDDVMKTWFQTPYQLLDYIEVLDKKSVKSNKEKGF